MRIRTVFLVCAMAGWCWGATYYVNGSTSQYVGVGGTYAAGNDGATGTSPSTAKKTLQSVLNLISTNGNSVHIAAGTYVVDYGASHNLTVWYETTFYADGDVFVYAGATDTSVLYTVFIDAGNVSFLPEPTTNSQWTFNSNNLQQYTVRTVSNDHYQFTNVNITGGASPVAEHTALYCSANLTDVKFTGGTWNIGTVGSGRQAICNKLSGITFDGVTFNVNATDKNPFSPSAPPTTLNTFKNCVFNIYGCGTLFELYPGAFTFESNVFHLLGTTSLLIAPRNSTGTGTLIFGGNTAAKGNTIDARGDGTLSQSSISITGLGAWTATVSNNTTTLPSVSQLYRFVDQPTPTIQYETISVDSMTSGLIRIYSTGTTVGICNVNYNKLYTKSATGDMIMLGTSEGEYTGAKKLNNSIVRGNTLYGPYYYNQSMTSTVSGISFNYQLNGFIENNYCNGIPAAMMFMGRGIGNTLWDDGRVFGNICIDCGTGNYTVIHVKGASGVAVSNNIIWTTANLPHKQLYSFEFDFPEASDSYAPQNCSLQNNLVYTPVTNGYLVRLGRYSTTGFSASNNHYITPSVIASPFEIQDVSTSTAYTWRQWIDLGYDVYGTYAYCPSSTSSPFRTRRSF